MRSRTGRVAAALTAAAALAALSAAAGATSSEASARNGEITFERESNFYREGFLWAVNGDGTRARRLYKYPTVSGAAWSPDGKRLAIVDQCAVKIMPAGGGRLRTILRGRREQTAGTWYWTGCWSDPAWSPDGKRLAVQGCDALGCVGGRALYVVEASGRGLGQLTLLDCVKRGRWACSWTVSDGSPDWSPDGKTILFTHWDIRNPNFPPDPPPETPYGNPANLHQLYRMDPDGTGLAGLPHKQVWGPKWSPDGSRIAFARIVWTALPPTAIGTGSIVVMNADGSNERTIVQQDQGQHDGRSSCGDHGGWSVAWSPDGSKLAYSGPCPRGIYVMNADGSGRVRLTRGRHDTVLDWRSLPDR